MRIIIQDTVLIQREEVIKAQCDTDVINIRRQFLEICSGATRLFIPFRRTVDWKVILVLDLR